MFGYGIQAGSSGDGDANHVIKLQGKRLIDDGPLEALAGGISLGPKSSAAEWTKLAQAVADELDSRSVHPLGIDAPLTLSEEGTRSGRPFEGLVQAPFRTPSTFDPWPKKSSSGDWLLVARLWTEVAYVLVEQKDWTLWSGEGHTFGTKIMAEVYPRVAWTTLAACMGQQVLKHYGRSVQVRDDTLAAMSLFFANRDRPNNELRDAAVCAATVGKVTTRTSGFLGKPLEAAPKERAFRGGGIAVPWLR